MDDEIANSKSEADISETETAVESSFNVISLIVFTVYSCSWNEPHHFVCYPISFSYLKKKE